MSNSILQSVGNLDVVNATLRAPKVEVTTSVGVANTSVTDTFSVGTKFHIDKDSIDPVSITGNVVASGIKISNLTIGPAFDFASVSNVGNVTANVIQFANATTGFTTTANVEIGGNISLTSNAQVKVGSNVLAEYTGPHPRKPKEMPIKKYPEIAFEEGKFDKNVTTNTYTQAGYTVSSSPVYNTTDTYGAWRAFDSVKNVNEFWCSQNNSFTTTGEPSGTISSFNPGNGAASVNAEYITVTLPHKIKLSKLYLNSRPYSNRSNPPRDGYVYGSIDGTNWTLIKEYSNTGFNPNPNVTESKIINVDSTDLYNHFALLVTKIYYSGSSSKLYTTLSELQLYGSEEPAPVGDLSLDTTLKSTFNSVRSNNYVMYFDGEDPQGSPVVPKYLPSGAAKTITPNNITFDATNNCWTLNGSTESNVTTGDLGFEGDVPHTVSMWVNASNLNANTTTQQLFTIGSGYDKALLKVDNSQIAANTWHNVTYAYQGEGGSKVTYVDGRKVEEEKVEDTFGVYPPFNMTDYEIGGYRVSASSEYTSDENSLRRVWNAYADGGAWMTEFDTFGRNASSNNNAAEVAEVTITDTDGASHIGHYTILETPFRLRTGYLTLSATVDSRRPESVVILGSNDNENWDLLYTNTSVPDQNDNTLAVGSTKGYKYHMFMVKNLDPNGEGAMYITRLKYYGHKEGDLTRFPEPTRVLEYPHVALSGPGQRGYVASASSSQIGVRESWNAFDGNKDLEWRSSGADYTGSDGSYVGTAHRLAATDADGVAIPYGEWLQIKLPNKILLQSIKLVGDTGYQNKSPEDFKLYGSTNGSTWKLLITQTGLTPTDGGNLISPASALSVRYDYYALVTTKVYDPNQTDVAIEALILNGTQEDTGTPAIVGGPFAGKVANFRVYDKYLGEERIQEIYDAQKDAFGHKKSSMTLYKGRIGVGTTEPEGALTVLDEPHALEKFPARVVSSDDGETVIRTADGSGYQVFDGLTTTSWVAKPERKTRLSEEVDFGAWLKIKTPESVSLKKADIESNPYWSQVGSEIDNTTSGDHFGRAVACSHDGTRVIVGGYPHSSNQGLVKVYDWNGSSWTQVGQTLTGTANSDLFGRAVAISGDGNIIAVAAPREHVGSAADKGTVRVYYLNGTNWTILPDSGSLTGDTTSGLVDVFLGETAEDRLGQGGVKLSYDGYTVAMGEAKDDTGVANIGRVRVFTYSNGEWSPKGSTLLGNHTEEEFGQGLDMSEDGNHLIIGTKLQGGTSQPPRVEVYKWNGSAWAQKGSSLTYADTGDGFGPSVSISNDGNTIAIGIKNADAVEGAPDLTTSTDDTDDNTGVVYVYHWNGSAWGTPYHLVQPGAGDHDFGDHQVMSGDGKRLIVGASNADYSGGTNSGRLYTFEFRGDSWLRRPVPMVGADGGDNAYLGRGPTNSAWSHAISRDGSVIVAGEAGFSSDTGRVRIYNMPSNIKSIWGSNDNENWTKITTAPTREEATSNVAGLQFGYDDRLEFKNIDNPNYYKYHGIVADAFTRLKEVKLFGVRKQGSSTLHDGTLTLTKNLTVPRIGPALDADDTPRRDRLVVEYTTSTNPMEDGLVRDTSGRGNDGVTGSGVSYDATEKSLILDNSTGGFIHRDFGSQISGNFIHSISMWVKGDTFATGNIDVILWIGDSVDNKRVEIYASTTSISYNFKNNQYDSSNSVGLANGVWNHIAFTYNGQTGSAGREIYVNGEVIAASHSGNADALNITNGNLYIGSGSNPGNGYDFDGSLSNFKLYDTVLTAEEVKTLYDMGRCDEGHHVVNFSKTRVGIGLGDGEAPRGALDVRDESYLDNVAGVFNVTGRTTTRRLHEINFPIPPISDTNLQQFFWLAQFGEMQWNFTEYLRFDYNLTYTRGLDYHNRAVCSNGYAIVAIRSQGATGSGSQYDNDNPVVRRVEYNSFRGFGEGPNFYYVRNTTKHRGYLVMGFRSTRTWTPANNARVTGTIQYNGNLDNIDTFNGNVYKHGSAATTGSINAHATLFPSTTLPNNFVAESGDSVTITEATQSTTYFTGQHTTYIENLPDLINHENNNGLIVSSNKNDYIHMTKHKIRGKEAITQDESLPITSLSTRQNDKTCFGVMSCKPFDEYSEKRFCIVNSLGEGAIWVVNTNGNLEAGDYITTSDVSGYGQKQDDDILRNYTVAKITMDCDFNPLSQPIKEILRTETDEYILDEDDQIQWTNTNETEMQYNIRYVDANGTIISQNEYTTKLSEGENVYIAAYVGCTYHCG